MLTKTLDDPIEAELVGYEDVSFRGFDILELNGGHFRRDGIDGVDRVDHADARRLRRK